MTTLRVFRLHHSVLFPCEWWGRWRRFLNRSNIETVSNKRQPGDSPQTTKHRFALLATSMWVRIGFMSVLAGSVRINTCLSALCFRCDQHLYNAIQLNNETSLLLQFFEIRQPNFVGSFTYLNNDVASPQINTEMSHSIVSWICVHPFNTCLSSRDYSHVHTVYISNS